MPHARERLRDNVQHAHATVYERDVVVAHVAEAVVRPLALAEKAPAECCGIEDPRSAQTRLRVDERVKKPGSVGKV